MNKKDPKNLVIVKQIKTYNNYNEILKEIYFIVCFQKNKYSIQLIDFFFSDDNKYIFIILNDEGENLQIVLDFFIKKEQKEKEKKKKEYNGLIKQIIFQIVHQLHIFHKNSLVHNDIKPKNILISSSGIVKIADFGSMDKINTNSLGTFHYRSPENLREEIGSEKNDMWAVGIIMIQLFKKEKDIFASCKNVDRMTFIKIILSKYKIIMNNNEINISNDNVFNIFNNIKSDKFKAELKNIDGIEDPDAFELIQNLLKLKPKERFSAEEALNSKYLSEYKNEFKLYNIYYKEKEYEDILSNNYNGYFIKNKDIIHQKFNGLELEK